MPSIFYLDYENGLDATTNTPLGWWSVAYTDGNGTQPPAETTVTGNTSGSTATVTTCTVSGGTWAGGNGAGTLYWYGKSAAFQSETLTFSNGATCTIGGDFTYCAWKTITSGATAARIAPGDTIRIAKSPAPVSIGNATWTNLSKTVTLATAQTANISTCESNWTAVNATSANASATDWKEGSNKVSIVEDGSPGANEVQAYKATGTLNLSSYQKISFWIKNEVAISANQWEINLCTVNDGTGEVDTFPIPAIPSTGRWIPLTIARNGGGNLNAAIESINVSNGSGTPTASKYIYLDNIIACTTNGLNLQSLISKNANEQSSTASVNASEGWYGIQSINGTTVLLDNDTNTLANAGMGYSTTGTTPETVETYKRETIKTTLGSAETTKIQEIRESGTAENYVSYECGYDTALNTQTGETLFDGLNGNGYGLVATTKSFISVRYLGLFRYSQALRFVTNPLANIILYISNVNNNSNYGGSLSGYNAVITIINCNNNRYGFSGPPSLTCINLNNNWGNYILSIDSSSNGIYNCNNILNNGGAAIKFTIGSNNIWRLSLNNTERDVV